MYPITQKVQTNNRTHKKFKPIGIVVHETATPGATDEAESAFFDRTTRKSSVHAFIDWDSITQKIPVDEIAWHAGPTANSKYLGIELCHPKVHDPVKFAEVWKRAVWYFAWLFVNYLHIYTVTQQVIPSHADCTRWWHETDHMDPESYFKEYGKTVDDFRKEVQQEINVQTGKVATPKVSEKKTIELIITANPTLHCRKGPGTQYDIIKDFNNGDSVTAVDLINGWYKLDINGTPGYIAEKYTVKK